MRFDDQRKQMINNQIKSRGINDSKVLNAFEVVPRELFVSDEWKEYAYRDHPLAIGFNQTISQPYIVALMMTLLQLKETDRVLEIGTGSGYQTALLAEIVAEVYTVERIVDLMLEAKKTLKKLEYKNIYYKIGDGSLGWGNAVPRITEFDKIIVSAGSPNEPAALFSQLANDGLLIIPQGTQSNQDLMLYKKVNGEIEAHNYGGCVFVPLIGENGWDEK